MGATWGCISYINHGIHTNIRPPHPQVVDRIEGTGGTELGNCSGALSDTELGPEMISDIFVFFFVLKKKE